MNTLASIETEITVLHGGFTLRPTLETARRIGELLGIAKAKLRHGAWLPWVRRMGMTTRTAQVYLQVSKTQDCTFETSSEPMSINQFLWAIRVAKRAARIEIRKENRAAAIADIGADDSRYQVHHADCTKFRWPSGIDCIWADPPWADRKAYRWLTKFCTAHLRPGGTVLVQLGQMDVAEVLPILIDGGLTFRWLNAITFEKTYARYEIFPLAPAWRPVIVLSRGKWNTSGMRRVSDTVYLKQQGKKFDKWEQPLKPVLFWLDCLTRPGSLIADPWACTGTVGVAVKRIGARSYLGTEIRKDMAKIAASRIAGTREGDYIHTA